MGTSPQTVKLFLFSLRKLKENQEMWSLLATMLITWQMHDFVDGAAIQEEEPFHIRAWNENRAADSEQDDWILLQHRIFVNDTDEFQENGWEQYKNGFGDANGTANGTAYWMGLEKMHQMTLTGTWQLLFIVKGKTENYYYEAFSYVIFDDFKIERELLHYELQIGSIRKKYGLFESVSDAKFTYNNGFGFNTKDRDYDSGTRHCAKMWKAGWWFRDCTYFSLNMDRRNVLKELEAKSRVDVTETQMAMKKVK